MKLTGTLTTLTFTMFAGMATGCGDDNGNADAGVSGQDATAGKDATTGQDATTGADASVVSLDCASYCAAMMATCTAGNAQYPSLESCLGTCPAFAVGTSTDTGGNTLGCRVKHVQLAAQLAMPNIHCPHAGPGGDGICGQVCDGFCAIQATACTGANQQFADDAACRTACGQFPAAAASYNTSHTSDNTNLCRLYHLTTAASNAAAATTHCGHIVLASATCTQ